MSVGGGTVALCAEMVGGMQWMLDTTVEYAKTRQQFGRTIGSFQAVQHQCADMLLMTESARSATYYAAWALTEGDPAASVAVSIAKAYCSDAYREVANRGVQIHGGIGFTWEHDLQLYYKRSKSSETLFGDATFHRERIARIVVDGDTVLRVRGEQSEDLNWQLQPVAIESATEVPANAAFRMIVATRDKEMATHIKELFDLSGRAAIVTGGSRGLGKEMAEGLAEAGASLMLCARREEWLTPTVAEFRERGFQTEGLLCDVANPEQVQHVVDKTVEVYGKVDILVNNAGVSWGERPEKMPIEKWHKVIDINLTGAFLFAQAAGREMLKREYGTDHQRLFGFGFAVFRGWSSLRRVRREQSRTVRLDARTRCVVGAAGHPSQRHRAGLLPFATRRLGNQVC